MKHTLSTLLLLIAIVFSSLNARACTCVSSGNYFCQTIHNDTSVRLIGLYQKIATVGYGFKAVKINQVYGSETPDTIMVWGDNGALCRMYDTWAVGDSMILALQECDLMGNFIHGSISASVTENTNDYQIWSCGYYTLDVQNGMVTGKITTGSIQSIPLSVFLAGNCAIGLGTDHHPVEIPGLVLSPVPASNQLHILMEGKNILDIEIFNTNGQRVYAGKTSGEKTTVDVSGLSNGLFYVRLQTNAGVFSKQVMINR